MINEDVREKFILKSKLISYLRQFLDSLGFHEVRIRMINLKKNKNKSYEFLFLKRLKHQ